MDGEMEQFSLFKGRFRSILSDNLEKYLEMLQVSDSIISTYLKSTLYLIMTPLKHGRLKVETEAWARSGQSTTVGSSYILEPGQPVQTTLYDGKLYTITGHHEVDTVVKIAQRPQSSSCAPESLTEMEVSEEG